MLNIGLVYFTNTDVTGQLMRAVITELEAYGCQLITHKIEGNQIIDGRFQNPDLFSKLHKCHAIVFGSPTYMGSVSAQFKAFADATSDFWAEQKWSGKLAAGVTSGTGLNGDQSSSLAYMQVLASQHGMLWVNLDAPYHDTAKGVNRLGCHSGVTAQSLDGSVNEIDLKTATYLARKLIDYAEKFNNEI
ncbi:flavodoxin family protein [Alteromonas sp. PRIM-21]|uniref:flavodoxin family protein n=1 Tax=Alteromonas sp. PRIM-21 TaxID=1454978 RepID=UPI0022B99EBF|nr:flavodoxin family protein [Alteromonas sp. PRIM-21]MCZ8531607.1 NAD(P)H-dependent oxidoreductase [Alteromonas sp. PRIM-21]